MLKIKDVRPRHLCWWNGCLLEVERQARRTTFALVKNSVLAGAKIQIKRDTFVYPYAY